MTHPWYRAAETVPVEATSRCGHVVTLMLSAFYRSGHPLAIRQQAERLCEDCRRAASRAAAEDILEMMKAPLPALEPHPNRDVERKGEWARRQAMAAIEKECLHAADGGYIPEDAVANMRWRISVADKKRWLDDYTWFSDDGAKYLRIGAPVPGPDLSFLDRKPD